MNFDFTEAEMQFFNNLQQTLSQFGEGRNPETRDLDGVRRNTRDALAVLSTSGYLNLGLDHAGMNSGGTLQLMAAMEIVAAFSQSLFLSIEMSTHLFGRILFAWGQGDPIARALLSLKQGKLLGAVALSEKTLNVENDPMDTRGVLKGDHVSIDGSKQYVVNGPIADWIAVVGKFHDSHAIFLVKNGTRGLEKHERIQTLGYEGAAICPMRFDDCRIPADQVIIPPDGEDVLAMLRLWENQILVGACLGMMTSSFEAAKAYAHAHQSGGKPIVAYQEVAFKLAEMLTLDQTSRLLAYRAAWMSDVNPAEAPSLTLCAKVFCAESAERVAGQALQILAGHGYQLGNKAESAFRCAKYAQIAGTSTEIARVKIGDEALGYV
jgi:alkylation response protein AidB-like acyl-CoA dehydrogenase